MASLSSTHKQLSAGLGSVSIKTKISISFDAYKLIKWLESEDFDKTYVDAVQAPTVKFLKGIIHSGSVKTEDGKGLSDATIKARKRRKSPPSIGGDRPLYDTGKLVNSIRFDKDDLTIKAVDYALGHIEGTHLDWNKKPVPARDFVEQMRKKRESAGALADMYSSKIATKKIMSKIRQKFSRRLAK